MRVITGSTGEMKKIESGYQLKTVDNSTHRWLLDIEGLEAPSIVKFKVKNSGGKSRIAIPNGEILTIEFAGTKLMLSARKSGTDITHEISSSYNVDKYYEFKIVFAGFSAVSSEATFHMYVDDVYYGVYESRKDSSGGIKGINIYIDEQTTLNIEDFSIENILSTYPELKKIESSETELLEVGKPYTYSEVIRNASGSVKPYTLILALYSVDQSSALKLEEVNFSDSPLIVGDNKITLSVTPQDVDKDYIVKKIRLEEFYNMKPIELK